MHKEIFDSVSQGFLDRLVEPTLTIIRRTYWTNGLVTEREVVIPHSEYISYHATEAKRLKTAPGIITTQYFDKRGRVHQTLPRSSKVNPLMAAPYGKAESLQDGECPCCRGSWPSPDATKCNGCGYELDEE